MYVCASGTESWFLSINLILLYLVCENAKWISIQLILFVCLFLCSILEDEDDQDNDDFDDDDDSEENGGK